jgi:uncharacterized protein YebE (UPF0316 family)
MDLSATLPTWGLVLLVFGLRIVDVSLGTVRLLATVQGWTWTSVAVGFVEVLIWLAAVSEVVTQASSNLLLALAYAGGFAAGTAAGIWIQRTFASGPVVLRLMSSNASDRIIDFIEGYGARVTTFQGEGPGGGRTMIYTMCSRKRLDHILDFAEEVDPEVTYVVEPALESRPSVAPTYLSSLRSIFIRK